MAFFTQANALEHASNGHKARASKSPKTAYNQAVAIQQLILREVSIQANGPENTEDEPQAMKPHDLAALARAFCDLEETKRKLKMKPLPGSLRPTESRAKRKVKEQVSFTPAPVETGEKTQPVGNEPIK